MNEVFNSISKYHLLETLIPGYIFISLLNMLIIPININDIFTLSIISYFVGLTISRISSLITKKILFKLTNTNGIEYDKYIKACERDPKIETLSTDKNLYRNIITICSILLILKIMEMFNLFNIINKNIIITIALAVATLIFSISFLKLNDYIVKRVRANIKKTR